MSIAGTWVGKLSLIIFGVSAALLNGGTGAVAQERVLGIDVSAWQTNRLNWSTLYGTNNRKFVFIRSSRGGTTGYYNQSDPNNVNGLNTQSQRYDDPYFISNITAATSAGMLAGSYHFSRPDILSYVNDMSQTVAHTGTDEANHFIEMAGPWMRPGYLLPMHDLEAGDGIRSDNSMAQFSVDFSKRIHDFMGNFTNPVYEVREAHPSIYTNGNYAHFVLGQATNPTTSQVVASYPTLVSARWPNQPDPNAIDVQNSEPKDSYSNIYGPWDDTGITHPWSFWQYASTMRLSGYDNGNSNIDVDVTHGDIEWLQNYLVPALWWNDSSGDWSTLTNWNSGQTPVAPVQGPGQVARIGSMTLPNARLPGVDDVPRGVDGQNDTVILERPNANITVTHSSGTHDIRKLFVREALNITGGSLTVNYDPTYRSDTSTLVLHAGPISAQFSGAVTLSGTGSLSVHTLQIDPAQTFTLGGGTLTFNKINLISNAATKIAVAGDVNINPLNNATAIITRSGSTGTVDLSGGTRTFTIGNGSADVDLSVAVPIINGGLTKVGAGTLRLDGANTFAGNVTINGGTLRYGDLSGLSNTSLVTVNSTGRLEMNGVSDTIVGLVSDVGQTTGVVQQGAANLTLTGASGPNTYFGTITGSGAFTKNGAASQTLTGANTLGPVNVNAGSLFLNGTNTTGLVTVNGGTFGGTGTAFGNVIVNNTGHVATGPTLASLDVGPLTLNAGSVLDMKLGAFGISDIINVAGLLTLNGGSVNLSDFNGFEEGVYTLLDYGTRTGSVASLGTPIGPAGYDYQLIDNGSMIRLSVSIAGVPGDFNDDGTVDAADYVVWKKFRDTDAELPNDGGLVGDIGSAHYDLWQQNFGRTEGGGGQGNGEVPEPSAIALLVLGLIGFTASRRGR